MREWFVVLMCGCGRLSFDSSTPTNDAATDAAPPFCSTQQALFCSDFDGGQGLAPWVEGAQYNGTFDLLNDTLHTINVDATDEADAYVYRALNVSGTRVRESTDVRVDAAGGGDPVLLLVRLTDATTIHGIEYVYRSPPGVSYVEEFREPVGGGNAVYNSWMLPASFPVGEWHRISVDLDVTTTPHTIISHDGTVVLDTPLVGSTGGQARIQVGLVYVRGPVAPWELRFDNVVADAQ